MLTKPYHMAIATVLCALPVQADHLEELVVTASQNTLTIGRNCSRSLTGLPHCRGGLLSMSQTDTRSKTLQ